MNRSKKIIFLFFCIVLIDFYLFSQNKDRFTYQNEGKRDPFFKIEVNKPVCPTCGKEKCECKGEGESLIKQIEELGLFPTAVMYDQDGASILIGDDILGVGDVKGPIVVREIQKGYVIYEFKKELVEIPFSIIEK